ncbi:MAG TPA: anthranilate synthase component I [Propionibacteriaceae bacterium]|nr:anthranilate synthase component I [Propionibacteriaceae bacterium]
MTTTNTSVRITPDLAGFRAQADAGRRVISVYAKVVADGLTPVGLYHHLCGTRPGTFLLESAEHGTVGRWSFVGVNALATLTEVDGQAHWSGRPISGLPTDGSPLDALATTLSVLHTEPSEGLPPFTSGMVGYLAYDVVRRLERLPDTCTDDLDMPELTMLLAGDVAAMDHLTGEVWLIANAVNFDDSSERLEAAYDDAVQRLEALVDALAQPEAPLLAEVGEADDTAIVRQRSSEEFCQMVRDAVEEIKAGEVFQVVPSQRFELASSADPLDVYRALKRGNPSPYLYLVRLDDLAIVGSSPEALVTVRDGVATMHPIAGTKPRGATEAEDAAYEADLLADDKEAAEHVMLVDLGRNDLGRVCEPGTVRVLEFMRVRRYSHVMHLEAVVTGKLSGNHTALEATLACFPAGTLSGAPKVRAMEIIDTLEKSRRGLYGGAVGYFDFAGNADTAIAIRTALLKDGIAYVQSGAGIVADSVPENEDAEITNKAAAVLRAVRAANSVRRLA